MKEAVEKTEDQEGKDSEIKRTWLCASYSDLLLRQHFTLVCAGMNEDNCFNT